MKYKNVVILLVIVSLLFCFGFFVFGKLKLDNPLTKIEEDTDLVDNMEKQVSCSRTTRLDNKPVYDRALSFIEEKYKPWDEEFLGGLYSYSTFPSQLTNCIKIDEDNLRNTTGEEGYFIFNGDQIKENYYPITVDVDYKYNDEAINALLLVHEITHVQQYIDFLNGKPEVSCIDKEAEAFLSQWKFYKFQFPETRKTIDLRIQNDKDLNHTLQIIETIQKQITLRFDERKNECLNNSAKLSVEDCIDEFDKTLIKDLLLEDDTYKKQCNL